MNILSLTEGIIDNRIGEASWLKSQVDETFRRSDFYLSFNLIHRKINDRPVDLSETEMARLKDVYPGFNPVLWTTHSWARTYLVLHVPESDLEKVLDDLFTTGDISEQEALYRMLHLLPDAGRFQLRAAEGIRTNMTRVFDAITLDNPFPAQYFNDGQWNQMVLKAIFMDRPLYRIQGLDNRVNTDLCRIAQDFAHERWAAGRKVTPELWRLTGKFAVQNPELIDDLRRVLKSQDPVEHQAGILALQDCDSADCRSLLEGHNGLILESWDELGKKIAIEK